MRRAVPHSVPGVLALVALILALVAVAPARPALGAPTTAADHRARAALLDETAAYAHYLGDRSAAQTFSRYADFHQSVAGGGSAPAPETCTRDEVLGRSTALDEEADLATYFKDPAGSADLAEWAAFDSYVAGVWSGERDPRVCSLGVIGVDRSQLSGTCPATSSAAGQVIKNCTMSSRFDVRHRNVTLQNVLFTSKPWGIDPRSFDAGHDSAGFRCLHCETVDTLVVIGSPDSTKRSVWQYSHFDGDTAFQGDCAKVGSHWQILDSVCDLTDDGSRPSYFHGDGFQSDVGTVTNFELAWSIVDLDPYPGGGANGACCENEGPLGTGKVHHNTMAGGYYVVRYSNATGQPLEVRDNRFPGVPSSRWVYCQPASGCGKLTVTGNTGT